MREVRFERHRAKPVHKHLLLPLDRGNVPNELRHVLEDTVPVCFGSWMRL